MTLFARDSLFVQNSGTLFSFAGITVRENTLRIVPTGAQPLRVFAFGRRINPDGSFVTNIDFFNEVQYLRIWRSSRLYRRRPVQPLLHQYRRLSAAAGTECARAECAGRSDIITGPVGGPSP